MSFRTTYEKKGPRKKLIGGQKEMRFLKLYIFHNFIIIMWFLATFYS